MTTDKTKDPTKNTPPILAAFEKLSKDVREILRLANPEALPEPNPILLNEAFEQVDSFVVRFYQTTAGPDSALLISCLDKISLEIAELTASDPDIIRGRWEQYRTKTKETKRQRQAGERLTDIGQETKALTDKMGRGDQISPTDLKELRKALTNLDAVLSHRELSPPLPLIDELPRHREYLRQFAGKKLIGLETGFEQLNQKTLGLRGLMLLAARPNIGKTALGVQLGVDIITRNPDAGFLFLSLEMPRLEIMTRVKCYLAKQDWKTLVMAPAPPEPHQLKEWGSRALILDDKNFPPPFTVSDIVALSEDFKQAAGVSRLFILIDYFQVFPIPDGVPIRSDLEADKWRIGAMKELRDLTGEAVMVISESRKPPTTKEAGKERNGEAWESGLTEVMGAARLTYTPDMVFVLNSRGGKTEQEQAAGLTFNPYSPQTLRIDKGRDGVTRGEIPLRFYYRQARFEESE